MQSSRFAKPVRWFAFAGFCLLPFGVVFFNSNWPPLGWKHTHYATGPIGRDQILPLSVIFLVIALVYFVLPKVVQCQMNSVLARLHFWANMIFLLVATVGPIVTNLAFRSRVGEPKLDEFFRRFGAGMEFFVWEIGLLVAAQLFLVANLVWTSFRGVGFVAPTQHC